MFPRQFQIFAPHFIDFRLLNNKIQCQNGEESRTGAECSGRTRGCFRLCNIQEVKRPVSFFFFFHFLGGNAESALHI